MLEADLLAAYPPEVAVPAATVAADVARAGRVLVVLDDDPTGTQSVADLPVLTRWEGAEGSADLRGDLLERFYAVVDAAGLDEDRARAWVVVRTVVELAALLACGDGTLEQVTWATTVVKAVQR